QAAVARAAARARVDDVLGLGCGARGLVHDRDRPPALDRLRSARDGRRRRRSSARDGRGHAARLCARLRARAGRLRRGAALHVREARGVAADAASARAGAGRRGEMSMESALPEIFMAIMGLSLLMYVILDGYDLGIGLLLPLASAEEKETMIASIGPFW